MLYLLYLFAFITLLLSLFFPYVRLNPGETYENLALGLNVFISIFLTGWLGMVLDLISLILPIFSKYKVSLQLCSIGTVLIGINIIFYLFYPFLYPSSEFLFERGFFIGLILWILILLANAGIALDYLKRKAYFFEKPTQKPKELQRSTKDFGLESTLRIQLEKKKLDDSKPEMSVEIKQRKAVIEQLLQKNELIKAINELEKIIEIAKLYNFNDIISWAEKNLKLSKVSKIKQTILDLGVKFSRLELREISERTGIIDDDLIRETIMNMMENQEIYGEYFSSTKSVVFEQQTNIDEIDNLMATYREWEEQQLGKKV